MTLQELFNKVQASNPHQYTNDMLLMWVRDLEVNIAGYIRQVYSELDEDEEEMADSDFDGLQLSDETQIEEPAIYIEWLCHKIDFANGEYDRANNHAAAYNAYMTNWKERYFRGHRKKVAFLPDRIRGL